MILSYYFFHLCLKFLDFINIFDFGNIPRIIFYKKKKKMNLNINLNIKESAESEDDAEKQVREGLASIDDIVEDTDDDTVDIALKFGSDGKLNYKNVKRSNERKVSNLCWEEWIITPTDISGSDFYVQNKNPFHKNHPFEVKHRRRKSPQQLKVLEKAFKENNKPKTSIRSAIAKQLDIDPRTVQVWFQNKRKRQKQNRGNKNYKKKGTKMEKRGR